MTVAVACTLYAQIYQVGPESSKPGGTQAKPIEPQIGWGSNIENARLARAAQMALQHGDYGLAFGYAQRATQAAPNDPQLWFLLGYAARLDGRFQESVDAYTRGIHLKPTSLDGLSGLAQVYSLMGRTADAERLLKQVVTSDPRRGDDALLLGDLYMRSRDYGNATGWLERVEQNHPGARAELLLARCYQQQGRMDLASRYLEQARKRAPGNPDVQRSMAEFYRETGRYPEAIAELKSIRNPNTDEIAELAYTNQLAGRLNESAKVYAQAADAQPKNLNLQLAAAQADVSVGWIDKANAFLKRGAAIDANHYRLHAIRATIAELQHRDQEAVNEYKLALASLPASPAEGALYGIQLHMDLVSLYEGLGDESAAHNELETAHAEINGVEATGPDRGPYLRLRALIKMDAGDQEGALADIKEALALDKSDRADLQLNGDILMKLGHVDEAIAVYKQVLSMDPENRLALTSLGYASRAAGHRQDAEKYFRRLAQIDSSSYIPYLALGDLYTANREFGPAQAAYSKGYELAPSNALIVAGGINAGIEAHHLAIAGAWSGRVTSPMMNNPQVLRERERYLSFEGRNGESAKVGEEAIKVLPKDRDVVVYLGYDYLHQKRYDDLLNLTSKYLTVLPKEPDIPLLAGYVHKHQGLRELARQDFTEALRRDPSVVTAYVNRGFVLDDLRDPQAAADDFESALRREPNNGEAHLGLAYADLDLHRTQGALKQADLAKQEIGDSIDIHLIRATAYGREGVLSKAAGEYRAALKLSPHEGALYLGLGETLFAERRYHEAIDELEHAKSLSPRDASIYAFLARSYANLNDRNLAIENVHLAEDDAKTLPAAGQSEIYISTGDTLNILGENAAAMKRFGRALTAPGSDRVGVRLAIAKLMAQQDQAQDAERQIALAMMEAEAGDTAPASGEQLIAAADVFRSLHEYDLSQSYLQRAKSSGAPDGEVRLGLADNFLAEGDTARAQAELAAIRAAADTAPDYQYLLAEANELRQRHENAQALTAFAQAAAAQGEDQAAEQGMLETGADEGLRVTPSVSLLSEFSVEPIFEDSTVYVLDSKLDASFAVPSSDLSLLPPPRSSLQTQWTDAFHLHAGTLPAPGGFFQIRNARGLISVPSTNAVVNRDTTDYTLNAGLNPTIHLGDNVLTFSSGVQETIRRDSLSPVAMNQNLFRMYTYLSTSSFFNAVSFSGYVMREAGPFTESNLTSRGWSGAIDFRVGAPWGKTALVTGWGANDQLFSPVHYEDYYTSSYIGIERRFSERLRARAMVEDLRAWRIVGSNHGIAQDLRPAGTIDYTPARNWDIQASTAFSSARGFHVYDATQNGFSVSYAMPFRQKFHDDSGEVVLKYPIRFSAGLQDEMFFNFSGGQSQQLRPYFQISLF